jgi:hypothetical protein
MFIEMGSLVLLISVPSKAAAMHMLRLAAAAAALRWLLCSHSL